MTRPREGGAKGGRGARGPAGSPDSARALTGGKAQTADFLRPRYRCLNVPRRRPAEAFSTGSLAAELVRGAEAPGEARGEDGERGSRGLRPRLSHRSARPQTLSRGLRVSTLLLFTLRWGLEARGAHSGPPGPRNEAQREARGPASRSCPASTPHGAPQATAPAPPSKPAGLALDSPH